MLVCRKKVVCHFLLFSHGHHLLSARLFPRGAGFFHLQYRGLFPSLFPIRHFILVDLAFFPASAIATTSSQLLHAQSFSSYMSDQPALQLSHLLLLF
jgi:hypothetical protein